jgi:hypothetical protein
MNTRRILVSLLIVGLVAACDSATSSPAPSPSAAVAAISSAAPSPSPSAAPSPSPTPTPTPTPSATPTPTPTPAPTPEPWKTYKSARFHYSIKYPPTWIVTPGTSKLSDLFDDFDSTYLYITRDTVSGSASVSLTVSGDIAYYKSHYKGKLSSNKAIRLAGWSGRILILTGVDNGQKVLIQRIVIAKGSVGYLMTMWSDLSDAAAARAMFKKMYLTWRPK